MTGILFIMFGRGGGKNEESEILGVFVPPPPPPSASLTYFNQPPTLLLTPLHPAPHLPLIKKNPPPKTSFPTPSTSLSNPKSHHDTHPPQNPHAHPLSRHYSFPLRPKNPTIHVSLLRRPPPKIHTNPPPHLLLRLDNDNHNWLFMTEIIIAPNRRTSAHPAIY